MKSTFLADYYCCYSLFALCLSLLSDPCFWILFLSHVHREVLEVWNGGKSFLDHPSAEATEKETEKEKEIGEAVQRQAIRKKQQSLLFWVCFIIMFFAKNTLVDNLAEGTSPPLRALPSSIPSFSAIHAHTSMDNNEFLVSKELVIKKKPSSDRSKELVRSTSTYLKQTEAGYRIRGLYKLWYDRSVQAQRKVHQIEENARARFVSATETANYLLSRFGFVFEHIKQPTNAFHWDSVSAFWRYCLKHPDTPFHTFFSGINTSFGLVWYLLFSVVAHSHYSSFLTLIHTRAHPQSPPLSHSDTHSLVTHCWLTAHSHIHTSLLTSQAVSASVNTIYYSGMLPAILFM